MKIFTRMYSAFRLGGDVISFIATEIALTEYERVYLGKDEYGIIFYNKYKDLWHMVWEACGALVGSDTNKNELINSVKMDLIVADPKILKQQKQDALNIRNGAEVLPTEKFLELFPGN